MKKVMQEIMMLVDPELIKIYKAASKKWGDHSQVMMCVEECAELQKELLHMLRHSKNKSMDSLIDELADVQIMIEQMRVVFKITPLEFLTKRADKLRRLKQRLEP